MRRRIFYFLMITLLIFCANLFVAHIASQTKPFTMGQILRAIASVNQAGNQKKALSDKIIKDIRERKVDFPLTKENEKLLRAEGATDEIIDAIRQNSPPLPTPIPTPILTPTPTPKPSPTVSATEMKNSIGMEFVKIPSGSFMMGSDKGGDAEKPVHKVTINYEFYMGKYEVTIGEWKKIMGDIPTELKSEDRKFRESDDQPIIFVSWKDAQEFIKKLNAKNDGYEYRLPSEAEWEYAARAGTTTMFAFGNDLSSKQANIYDQSGYLSKTAKVGSYVPNTWGLHDMHGNVAEWVEDIYSPDYSRLMADGSANLSVGNSSMRVIRGGVWNQPSDLSRSAKRFYVESGSSGIDLGFRLVARAK